MAVDRFHEEYGDHTEGVVSEIASLDFAAVAVEEHRRHMRRRLLRHSRPVFRRIERPKKISAN